MFTQGYIRSYSASESFKQVNNSCWLWWCVLGRCLWHTEAAHLLSWYMRYCLLLFSSGIILFAGWTATSVKKIIVHTIYRVSVDSRLVGANATLLLFESNKERERENQQPTRHLNMMHHSWDFKSVQVRKVPTATSLHSFLEKLPLLLHYHINPPAEVTMFVISRSRMNSQY